MSIYNTPRLSADDVNAMNAALRALGRVKFGGLLSDADIFVPAVKNAAGVITTPAKGIAAYFGVTAGTVNRWLAPLGSTYRRCLPLNDTSIPVPGPPPTQQLIPGAVNRRVYCMNPEYDGYAQWGNDPPKGIDPATGTPYADTNLLAKLRNRIWLCSALAMATSGGFKREPIFNGDPLEIRRAFYTIAEGLDLFRDIWLGDWGPWIAIAWIDFTITPDLTTDGKRLWIAIITYNQQAVGEDSDLLELMPTAERTTPTQLPNCP